MDLTDNTLAVVLAVIALFGNVVVAYIGYLRDKVDRTEVEAKIEESRGGGPTDEHVVEMIGQSDALHALCKKLLLQKGRREAREREQSMQLLEGSAPVDSIVPEPRRKSFGVIRKPSTSSPQLFD